jgi:hypothetical protein
MDITMSSTDREMVDAVLLDCIDFAEGMMPRIRLTPEVGLGHAWICTALARITSKLGLTRSSSELRKLSQSFIDSITPQPGLVTSPDICLCGDSLPCPDHSGLAPIACYNCGSTRDSVLRSAAGDGVQDPICCEIESCPVMTLAEFQATRRDATAKELAEYGALPGARGFAYLDGALFIEDTQFWTQYVQKRYYLRLVQDECLSDDLGELEAKLFRYAESEGMLKCAPTCPLLSVPEMRERGYL